MTSVVKGSTHSVHLEDEPSQAVQSVLQEEQLFIASSVNVPLGQAAMHVKLLRYLPGWQEAHLSLVPTTQVKHCEIHARQRLLTLSSAKPYGQFTKH